MKFNDSLHVSQLRVVLHLCGFLVLLYSLSMLPPMVIALLNKERTYFAFDHLLTFFSLGGRPAGNPSRRYTATHPRRIRDYRPVLAAVLINQRHAALDGRWPATLLC